MESKTMRVAKWDNLKAFLILCVVTGHILYFYAGSSTMAKGLYLFLYTFHMPVFIFLAGMFSKHAVRERKTEKVIEYALIYVVMKFLEYIGDYLVNVGKAVSSLTIPDREATSFFAKLHWGLENSEQMAQVLKGCKTQFHFLWTDAPSWFALAMAVFLLVTMFIQKYDKAYCLGLALLIGCLAGLDNHFGDHYASLRICVFYPVFLMGYYTDRRIFEKDKMMSDAGEKRQKKPVQSGQNARIAAMLGIVVCLILCLCFAEQVYPYVAMLKGTANYAKTGLGILGIFWRAVCYIFWGLMIVAFCILAPDRENPFSWIGKKTMPVFIWHRLPVYILFAVSYGEKTASGKYMLMRRLPHCYLAAVVCIAVILTVLTTYLPEFRIADHLMTVKRKEKEENKS